MRFPMSLRLIVYVDPKLPRGILKRSVQNLNNNQWQLQNGTREDVSY